ncbi:ComEC/Rec2 family competence protein [Flaviflagellibacter deserti]|uniref:ComEC/Rec2 family competence protein n=1 Tax=Flaviflagellibacter deserti TaxID=2267266 RepID=A0ABV9Z5J7_9HYPH
MRQGHHDPNDRGRAIAATQTRARASSGFDLRGAIDGFWTGFHKLLSDERDRGRYFLWLPVFAIGGVLTFFEADTDPALWAAVSAFSVSLLVAFLARSREAGFLLAAAAVALSGGFFASAMRVEMIKAPILQATTRGLATGIIESVEPRPRGHRIVIALDSLSDLSKDARPARVRVTVGNLGGARAGSRVSLEALWRPPPGPVRPGGYDFGREAFFKGIGAVGSDPEALTVLAPAPLTFRQRAAISIDNIRNRITSRIVATVPGDSGAIAAALVTGQRGEISSGANDALRTAGLYHVISISGLHMALFGGTLFAVVRFALTLIPGIGLGRPIKKWSAVVALIGSAFYLALSGGEVATQRSFVMVAFVFMAVILDRQAVTMRNLALAALCAIVLVPESVLGPSFQMSFAAVMAIVAWYEGRSAGKGEGSSGGGLTGFIHRHFAAIVATTVAATVATAPFGTFHFQRIAVHALPSNLLALPIVSLLIMPWALIGLVLYPVGLDSVAWQIMGYGIGLLLVISREIATWPYSTVVVPAFSGWAVLALAGGLCWLAIWSTRLRWLGMIPVVLGVMLAADPPRPDIYVDAEGKAVAVRGPDGTLDLAGVRFASFAAENWLAADGDSRSVRDKSASDGVRCDRLGCAMRSRDGRWVSLTWSYAGLREDCRRAAIVITRLIAPPGCRDTALVIDGRDLAEDGAITVSLREGGLPAMTRSRGLGVRAWHAERRVPDGPPFVQPPQQSEVLSRNIDMSSGAFVEDSESTDDGL